MVVEGGERSGAQLAFLALSFVVFAVEYGARLWSCVERSQHTLRHPCTGRLRWMRKPLSALDLIVLVTFLVDFILGAASAGVNVLRLLRLLRVLSFLRFERRSKAFKRLAYVLGHKKSELAVAAFAASVFVLFAAVCASRCAMRCCMCRGGSHARARVPQPSTTSSARCSRRRSAR